MIWLDWVVVYVLPVILVFSVPMLVVPLMVIVERRACAFIQDRVGPNRVDLPLIGRLGGLIPVGGLGQPLADAIKLLAKEDIIPARADAKLYSLAPMFALVPPLIVFAVLPMSKPIAYGGQTIALQVADPGIGVLFILAVLSLSSYGVALGGWASNSRYSMLGAIRASAQMISYEVGMGLVLVSVLLMSGSVRMSDIVLRQAEGGLWGWNVFSVPGAIGLVLFTVCAFAENNRLPFDLPECESELVGGYHTEYSAMKFGMFLQGEYVAMMAMSALIVTLFLGGWHLPGIDPASLGWVSGLLSALVFLAKVMAIMFLYIWVRWTLPRFRYDQLMDLGWKGVIPIALANIVLAAVLVANRAGAL